MFLLLFLTVVYLFGVALAGPFIALGLYRNYLIKQRHQKKDELLDLVLVKTVAWTALAFAASWPFILVVAVGVEVWGKFSKMFRW